MKVGWIWVLCIGCAVVGYGTGVLSEDYGRKVRRECRAAVPRSAPPRAGGADRRTKVEMCIQMHSFVR
jgi:hypothetical protein